MNAGLVNPGAIGFLTTWVQVFFHLPAFRRSIYSIKTDHVADPPHSVPLATQKLLYKLQKTRDGAVETSELTKSFGWGVAEVTSQQQDILEFFMLYLEALSKETGRLGGTTPMLFFEFQLSQYIKCVKVPEENARSEDSACS